jgi:hypothetical protein
VEAVLPAVMFMLDKTRLDYTARSNPVKVVRSVAAMVSNIHHQWLSNDSQMTHIFKASCYSCLNKMNFTCVHPTFFFLDSLSFLIANKFRLCPLKGTWIATWPDLVYFRSREKVRNSQSNTRKEETVQESEVHSKTRILSTLLQHLTCLTCRLFVSLFLSNPLNHGKWKSCNWISSKLRNKWSRRFNRIISLSLECMFGFGIKSITFLRSNRTLFPCVHDLDTPFYPTI